MTKGRNRQKEKQKKRKMKEEEMRGRGKEEKSCFVIFNPVFCFPVTVLLSLDFPSENLISTV